MQGAKDEGHHTVSWPRRPGARLAAIALCSLCALACGDGSTLQAGRGPSYHGEVAAILAEHCLACHNADGIAGLAFDDVDVARGAAEAIADATETGRMPPWHVEDDGSCRSFTGGPTIDDEAIATLRRWADAGAPAGDVAPLPEPPIIDALENVSVVLDPGESYAPSATSDSDDYRCFVVDPALDADRFLTAYEVRPGVERMVHHVVLYATADATEAAQVRALDDAEAGPGYTCYGGPGTLQSRSLAAWAPGTQATRYPTGTGLRLLAGLPLVMQVHYSSGDDADRTTIGLQLSDSVAEEAIITGVFDVSLQLPPGMESVSETAALPLPPFDKQLKLYGIYPHMHRLGTRIDAFLDRGGDTTCLVNVPRYDDDWQRFYFYDEPVVVPPPGGGFFRIACDFDTRGVTDTVFWGEDASDEMCIAAIYATY
jgi:mono/diheme cytochrome c family protein